MVTDKEYLTFCNASNLDWQFTKLELIKDIKDYNGNKVDRFPYLSELLDPKNFIKEYKDENGKITKREKVYDNIDEMRSKAGVLFNYLEEIKEGTSGEGSFLGQWEAGKAINN